MQGHGDACHACAVWSEGSKQTARGGVRGKTASPWDPLSWETRELGFLQQGRGQVQGDDYFWQGSGCKARGVMSFPYGWSQFCVGGESWLGAGVATRLPGGFGAPWQPHCLGEGWKLVGDVLYRAMGSPPSASIASFVTWQLHQGNSHKQCI